MPPPQGDAAFVAAMEEVLDLYALPPDPRRPLVCPDEFCKQLVAEVAPPASPSAGASSRRGRRRRQDCEYVRRGSASAFMIAAPHLGRREVFVSGRATRKAVDYAEAIEFLCETMFPDAEQIVLVQDNLNTHCAASLYKRFGPEKARALASRIRWHYTPKHGSWLNIAEIEISLLARGRLKPRIAELGLFRDALRAHTRERNAKPCPISWQFTNERARVKLRRLYPTL